VVIDGHAGATTAVKAPLCQDRAGAEHQPSFGYRHDGSTGEDRMCSPHALPGASGEIMRLSGMVSRSRPLANWIANFQNKP
jgi:hypothetical protein